MGATSAVVPTVSLAVLLGLIHTIECAIAEALKVNQSLTEL